MTSFSSINDNMKAAIDRSIFLNCFAASLNACIKFKIFIVTKIVESLLQWCYNFGKYNDVHKKCKSDEARGIRF